jgi:transposase-like protein
MREIQGFLLEKYGIEVSPDFISTVTDAVIDEVRDCRILAPGLRIGRDS